MKVMISDPILGSRYWIWTVYAAGLYFPCRKNDIEIM
jgi:hypothetical protein